MVIKTHSELGKKRMALAGQHHVLIAVVAHADWAPCHFGRQGGERRQRRGLGFLAAEATAHARAGDHHFVRRDTEHMGDDVLNLGRMLGRAGHLDGAVLARLRVGSLHLEIKMLLPADGESSLHDMRCFGQRNRDIPSPHEVRLGVETLFRDALFDGENRRERLVFNQDFLRCSAALVGRLADHQRDNMPMKLRQLVGEQLLVLADRANVIESGDILRHQHGADARHAAGRIGIPFDNLGVSMRRMHRPHLKGDTSSQSHVIAVESFARDVLVGAFVRQSTFGGNSGFRQRLAVLAPLGIMVELFQQAGDQTGAVIRTAARIADRLELLGQHTAGAMQGVRVPLFPEQKLFRAKGARRSRRHSAEGEAGGSHRASSVHLHGAGGRHRADIHLAALGDLKPVAFALRTLGRLVGANHHLEQNLITFHRGLAVRDEKIRGRNGALAARRGENDRRVEGEEDGGGVPDRRRRHEIATQGGAVADLARAEDPQHFRPHGKFSRKRFADLRQRHCSADVPYDALFFQATELRHGFRGNQDRELFEFLADLEAEFGCSRDQPPRGILPADSKKFFQRGGTKELPAG